jgi:hypothetical protein
VTASQADDLLTALRFIGTVMTVWAGYWIIRDIIDRILDR